MLQSPITSENQLDRNSDKIQQSQLNVELAEHGRLGPTLTNFRKSNEGENFLEDQGEALKGFSKKIKQLKSI